jgi:hypothetical protein
MDLGRLASGHGAGIQLTRVQILLVASFHEDKYFWSIFFDQLFIRMFRKEQQAAPPQDAMLHCIQ